ncbi:hypothetical protein [Cypionkella sp. TWP1-2-1b2]|uniref:hypothetical protein n=1 Tax=Cypionkella sp. TWP1-2-1b2 TaxID=2804675 RepID=UPI003CE98FDE
MFENDTAQFEMLVSNSKTLQTKWTAVCKIIQKDIANRFGISVDESTVRKIGEARLMTLSNSPLDKEQYSKQVEALPALQEVIKIREINSGNLAARKEALEAINAMPNRTKTNRADKISEARRLNVASSGATYDDSGLSHEQKVQQLLTIASPAERISKARAWGILK